MKALITLDDGTTKELVEVTQVFTVPLAEVEKIETEVAAVDAELKTDIPSTTTTNPDVAGLVN